ncbi:MAG: methylaspartate mutase, partial [Planctomycetaceae bacterium]|nr:methylaspartate mutase [Planctomycetaceae bacterium]
MPHLGVLASVHSRAALEVFEKDCLIYLGTCVAAKGRTKPGKQCFSYEISGSTLNERGEMSFGDVRLFPLGLGETARITVEPARGFDVGGGPGKRVEREVRGGTVGLILDARGRPLILPEDRAECRRTVKEWSESLRLYEGSGSPRRR